MTWNVAGRVRDVARQAAAIAGHPVDVLMLQEVRASAVAAWTAALEAQGYGAVSATLAPSAVVAEPSRRLGVLIATRAEHVLVEPPELPWPERHLAVLCEGVELHCLHSPISSKPGQVKVRTLEAIV